MESVDGNNSDLYTFQDNEETILPKYTSSRQKVQSTSDDSMSSFLESNPSGCNRNCYRNCSDTIKTSEVVNQVKTAFNDLSGQNLKEKLLAVLESQDYFNLSSTCFCLGKVEVCNKSFSRLINVPERIIVLVLKDHKNGVTNYVHGRVGVRSQNIRSVEFIAWLYNFAKKVGEFLPTSNTIHLPTYLRKSDVFYYYIKEKGRENCIKMSTFYKIFKFEFGQYRLDKSKPMITIRKNSAHSKCTQCMAIKQFRQTARTELDVQLATNLLDLHHHLHQNERLIMVRIKYNN